jgi:hypothetical protein
MVHPPNYERFSDLGGPSAPRSPQHGKLRVFCGGQLQHLLLVGEQVDTDSKEAWFCVEREEFRRGWRLNNPSTPASNSPVLAANANLFPGTLVQAVWAEYQVPR